MRARGLIRAWARLALAIAVAGCASVGESADTPVCRAVIDAAAAQSSGSPSRTVEYFPIHDPDTIMGVGCRHDDDPVLQRFCDAILGNTSFEFFNAFAYDVVECTQAHGQIERIETDQAPSGLLRHPYSLRRMSGRISGANLELQSREAGGFALTFHRP